jgi:N-carbamoylputrescine amidase
MQGHAAANMLPLVCANRIGTEKGKGNAAHSPLSVTFHGRSFIVDGTGEKVTEAGRNDETIIMQEFDLEQCKRARENWGLFRDRRPAMYGALMTSDGICRYPPG